MWIYLDNDSRVQGYNHNNMEGNTGWIFASEAPPEDFTNYLYVDGTYVQDPLSEPEQLESMPTQLDIIEAQVTYTAMMTDTLLEV